MAQITLRGLEARIEKEIRKRAKGSGQSLNRVVQDMLQKATDSEKKKLPKAASLKKLAGGWNAEDASEFFKSIKICEQIDEAMWK
jgi:plasmid stability protein